MAVSQARWVVLLWILGMGSLGLSLWASAVLVPGAVTWQEAVWALLFGSAFLAVGAVLVVRRPAAMVGRICLLTGLTMAAAADLRTLAIVLDRQPGPIPPIGAVAANLSSIGTSFAALILGAVLLARFPDGRDRGRLAALADVTAALASVGLLASLFVPGPDRRPVAAAAGRQPAGHRRARTRQRRRRPDPLARRLRHQRHRLGRHPRPPLPPIGRRHPRTGPVGRRGRDRADRAVPRAARPSATPSPVASATRCGRRGSCRRPCCRSRSASRSCATACTTSTGSSAGRSPTRS